jgi:hypothetical protein
MTTSAILAIKITTLANQGFMLVGSRASAKKLRTGARNAEFQWSIRAGLRYSLSRSGS